MFFTRFPFSLSTLILLKKNIMDNDDRVLQEDGNIAGGMQVPMAATTMQEDIPLTQEGEVPYTHELFPAGAGMWNHLRDNNVDASKNQVFKRVENPQTPHVYVPFRLDPGYAIQPQHLKQGQLGSSYTGQYIEFADAKEYAATGTRNTSANDSTTILRYSNSQIQRGEWGSRINGPIRWENAGRTNNNHFCTHTLFPVKFTRTYAKKIDTFYMSYYVFYSSVPIKPHEKAFTPAYKEFILSPDATVDGVGAGASVKVDMTLINDENAILAIIASCQNSYAKSNSYITFIPRIDESLYTSSVNWSSPTRYTFGGSSCGMAVFAAIKGWMSVLYTGYINAPVPGGKFISNEETREAMVQQRYGTIDNANNFTAGPGLRDTAGGYQSSYQDEPWYLRASDQPARQAGQPALTSAPSVISRVMAQPNFVESVGGIFSKIVYAAVHHIPIFIPMQSSFRVDMVSYIARFRQSPKAIQWMGIVPTCYTAAMMEDGYPMVTRSDQSATLNTVPNIFMPLTFTDANAMQLRFMLTIAYNDNVNAEVGFAGGPINRNAQRSMFRSARDEMINLAASESDRRYASQQGERDAMQEARDRAEKENLDRPQRYELFKQTRQPFKVERERKAAQKDQAKKATSNRVKLEVDRIRARIKQGKLALKDQMSTLKDQYMKIAKPTEQESKTFALEMKKLRESKPAAPKKQYAQIKGMTPTSAKFRKEADGTYSKATKDAMKRLKDANDKIINANPRSNPGLTTAAERKEAAEKRGQVSKNEKAILEKYRKQYGNALGQGNFGGLRRQRYENHNASARGVVGDIAHGVGDVLDILDL